MNPKNWLVHFIHKRELKRVLKDLSGGRILDLGCGEKPFKKGLRSRFSQYVGLDYKRVLSGNPPDVRGNALRLPFKSGSFDVVLSTSVLEHLEEPFEALRDCFRVLRENGVLCLSAPFIWHIHEEPRDFFRFSKYGLTHLLEKAGFKIRELKALSGFWVTFTQLLVYNLYRMPAPLRKIFPLLPVLAGLIQICGFFLNVLDRSEQWTFMYLVVARKEMGVKKSGYVETIFRKDDKAFLLK